MEIDVCIKAIRFVLGAHFNANLLPLLTDSLSFFTQYKVAVCI